MGTARLALAQLPRPLRRKVLVRADSGGGTHEFLTWLTAKPRRLPLKGYAQNQLWCEIVPLACDLLAWMQLLALTGTARRWEPKRLRLRIFAVAGRLVRSGRRLRLRLAEHWPWAAQMATAATRIQALRSG